MSHPDKVVYISPAAELAHYDRAKQVAEEMIAQLRAELKTTRRRIKRLQGFVAHVEANVGSGPDVSP